MGAAVRNGADTDTGKRVTMADPADMKAHETTYVGMLGWLKWGAVICFLLAFLVIWLIS
jgi:hypothetical protein